MANVNLGTKVSLNSTKLPAGYTVPADPSFTDWEWTSQTIQLSVLKATIENVTQATTLTNIITDATIGINKQVSDLVSAVTPLLVTIYSDLLDIKTNLTFDVDMYGVVAPSYLCTVKYYYKTT